MRLMLKLVFVRILLIASILCLSDCKVRKEEENFETFYQKFHSDSSFQYDRIKFPLRGINTDSSDDTTGYYWGRENWVLHRLADPSKVKVVAAKSDTLVREKITTDDPGFYFEREFRRIEGKWYLTYYADINL